MKFKYAFIAILLGLIMPMDVKAQEVVPDEMFFKTMSEALDAHRVKFLTSMDTAEKQANAEANYFLDLKASKAEALSSHVRFMVADGAVASFSDYITSLPQPSTNLTYFITSSNLSRAIFLIVDSQRLLAQIPRRPETMGVAGPEFKINKNDSAELRAAIEKSNLEIEKKIAANHEAWEENNHRDNLKKALPLLKIDLNILFCGLPSDEAELFENTVKNSQLTAEYKAAILSKYR